MSQIPNLENAPINLAAIRARARSELEIILKNIRGDKCLVMDPKLGGSLSFLIHSSDLKEHGAELRYLTPEPIQTERTKVIYLVRAQLDFMKFISSHIHSDTSKGIQREYHLYFVPRRLVVCEKKKKVHSLLNIGEFPLYMIPLDEDVLSFELDLAQKEYLVDGDTTCLWHIAKAIHSLEFSFGIIPNIMTKGKAAARVADMLGCLQAEEPANTSDVNVPEINTLILLDREVDMVTPMCSQMTYEGLLDEFIGINNGALEVDASVMGVQQEGKKTRVPLNSSDKLYKEIRDLNFEVVIQLPYFSGSSSKATSMKQDYTDITNTTQVSELKDFVRKLHSLPEMTRHINLAQHLSTLTSKPSFHGKLDMEQTLVEAESYEICFDYVEELIHKQEPLEDVLRLLVLLSITNSGLPKKNFDYLRREFLHSYGFEHISTLYNLEKAGLFKKQDSKSNWLTIKRAFQLVVENRDTSNPKDISYVFSGYAPLSVRLIQQAMRSGWRPIEEILKLLPGPHSETKRRGMSYEKQPGYTSSSEILDGGRRPLVFVVFIGGVTFAEISALRFLSSQEGMAYELLVGTTRIVNGRSLIETFVDKLG